MDPALKLMINPTPPANISRICMACSTSVDTLISNVFNLRIEDNPCVMMAITAASPATASLLYDVYYDLNGTRFPASPENTTEYTLDLLSEGLVLIDDFAQCPITF